MLLPADPTDRPASTASGRHRDPAGQRGQHGRTAIRHDLQGLRAVAVTAVVVYHLRDSWLPGGFAGVDVFFVLSGFFITGLLLREIERRRSVDLMAFWGRRARRLLPASLLVLVVTVLAGRAMTNPLEAHRIARDGLFSTVFGMNWHEAASGLAYGQDPDPSPFQHYWSLAVEEQFYLAWPLLLFALTLLWRRRAVLTLRRTVVVVAVAAGLPSFLLALQQTSGAQPYAYYGTFGRVWQLALGGVLAAAVPALTRLPRALLTASRIAGVGVIAGFYAAAPSVGSYPGSWSLLPAFGAGLIVLAGEPTTRREPVARLLSSRVAQLGGRYSYSWYLWHWPPLVLLPIALDRRLNPGELVVCGALTLVAAVLTYHLVEDPLRRNRWLGAAHGGRSLQFGAALMAVGLVASALTSFDARRAAEHSYVYASGHRLLRPQPAAAAKERFELIGAGCELSVSSAGLAPDCRMLPNAGHGDVVLVGDSHASAWYPAVRKVAKENRWGLRAWTRASCPFADVHKQHGGGDYTACTRWREDVITRLIAARPSLVVVAGYAQAPLHLLDPQSGRPARSPHDRELYRDGLVRSLTRLRSAGLHILVLADVPAFDDAGPDCVLAHPHALERCSLPESEAVLPDRPDRTAAAMVPGVHLVDFARHFCHDGRCYQVVGNVLAYRDANHMTDEMTMRLAGELDTAARAAIA